jgi:hypothetical protein
MRSSWDQTRRDLAAVLAALRWIERELGAE